MRQWPRHPEDNLESVFQRFYTDRPEGEAFGQNSGLGLSISRQIIEAHGGELSVANGAPVLPALKHTTLRGVFYRKASHVGIIGRR